MSLNKDLSWYITAVCTQLQSKSVIVASFDISYEERNAFQFPLLICVKFKHLIPHVFNRYFQHRIFVPLINFFCL